jgi:tRNA-splicing ligase RtcB
MSQFDVIDAEDGKIIKIWARGVQVEDKAIEQLKKTASLPFIYRWVAAMPDSHWGMGATIGSVVATKGAIIPAAVGVDIGCGMMAVKLNLTLGDLGNIALGTLRAAIEKAVPTGRTNNGDRKSDRGGWQNVPDAVDHIWCRDLSTDFADILEANPGAKPMNDVNHLATLGTGNHFIELVYDETGQLWVMLHSGSRGPGNKFGVYFVKLAKEICKRWFIQLPDPDLAYIPEGTPEYARYMKALHWSMKFAWHNRILMMERIIAGLQQVIPSLDTRDESVHCHHNYAAMEKHYGQEVMVTRKGAVRAQRDELGIIPGSMGTRSYIVRGKGCQDSFQSCSHGAGRAMGRKEALKRFTLEDHIKATEGIECAKDVSVLDETPLAYKDIDSVMAAQTDLVEIVHTFKQLICVKGAGDGE